MQKNGNSSVRLVSVADAACLLPSFSISCSASWDAEKQTGESLYSFLMEGGQIKGGTACIDLNFSIESSEAIHVKEEPCTLFRIIESKITGFIAVVRRSWAWTRRSGRTLVNRLRWKRVNFSPHAAAVLSYAGGLRL